MKKILMAFTASFMLFSCAETEDFVEENSKNPRAAFRVVHANDNYAYKKKFALALHKAFVDYPAVREFIKTEAQKKFDMDYDVLYNYVKNENIGTRTFREILLQYFASEQDLAEIENAIPALTIFVPKLPNNSFSADSWNISTQVPMVAIRLLDNEKVPVISSNSINFLLDGGHIPAFPVVVIKECERIITPDLPGFLDNKTSIFAKDSFTFKFSDIYFNNISPQPFINPYQNNIDKLIEAWEINGEEQNLGWHRDHVYYNINPSNPNGPFINSHREQITTFKIESTTESVYECFDEISNPSNINSDFNDPDLQLYQIQANAPSKASFWTDGDFDFKVVLDHGAKSGTNILTKPFGSSPENLFEIQYGFTSLFGNSYGIYYITSMTAKAINPYVDLTTWRLEDYSNQWHFVIYEVDLDVEEQETDSRTVKYNANFGLEPTYDAISKLGMKFGSTLEDTQTKTITRKWQTESNHLGDALVLFGDNVVISDTNQVLWMDIPYHTVRKYNLGYCTITVRPVKVQ